MHGLGFSQPNRRNRMKKARILLMLLVIAFFIAGYAFGQEVPKGVKVAGSPEVMPTQAEIIKAIPPSLKALGKGKTIRIMFQGGGDSAPPLELKELIERETGLKLTIDMIPPENLHERQLAFLLSGAAEHDLLELYPTWIGEYAAAGFLAGAQRGLYGFGTLALKTWWAVDYWANVYRNRLAADGVKFSNGLVNDNGESEL